MKLSEYKTSSDIRFTSLIIVITGDSLLLSYPIIKYLQKIQGIILFFKYLKLFIL